MKNIKNILNKNESLIIIILFIIISLFIILIPRLNNNFIKTRKLYITEIMANNTYTHKDEDGDYSDYIEIYNGYNYPINLDGYYLSDSEFETNKWQFPNIKIEPKQYLIIYASGKDKCSIKEQICHTNFKLSSKGEIITLTDKANNIINKFAYKNITNDIAYGYVKNKYALMNKPSPKEKNTTTKFKYSKLNNKDIYINEYMIHNQRNTYDQEGNYNDWLELYNNSDKTITLDNIYLSDDKKDLTKYKLPNIEIKSNDYLLIYLGEKSKTTNNQITANFKLSKNDKDLIISNGKKIIDQIKVIELRENISYGKKDDNWYYFTMPTPGKINDTKEHTSLGGQK